MKPQLDDNVRSYKTNMLPRIGLGAGCFWCTEGVLGRIEGIMKTEIGYGGGNYADPNYRSVTDRPAGHVEVCILHYDPIVVSLPTILSVFFAMHDPTRNIEINDKKGELYRSAILYTTNEDLQSINQYLVEQQTKMKEPIVTEVMPLKNFSLADEKYQNYYTTDPNRPFCRNVITPKINKIKALGLL